MQPLELVGAYMQLQACWVEAAAGAEDGFDFARRLESNGDGQHYDVWRIVGSGAATRSS